MNFSLKFKVILEWPSTLEFLEAIFIRNFKKDLLFGYFRNKGKFNGSDNGNALYY